MVRAEDMSTTTSVTTATAPAVMPVLKKANEVRKTLGQERETLMSEKKDLREQIQQKREEIKQENETKREAFRAKLSEIKDTRKQAILERIDNRLTTLNTNMTDKWVDALDRMTVFVDRIGSEAATLKAQGTDTTAVDAAIAQARLAISTAQTSVAAQASTPTVLTITTETALRATIGSTVSKFNQDLRATYQTVVAARKAVVVALRALNTAKQPIVTPDAAGTVPEGSTESAGIQE